MADQPAAQFHHARKWLVTLMNRGKRKPEAPKSPWQQGCPELFPSLPATAFWDCTKFAWAEALRAQFEAIRDEVLSLRGKGIHTTNSVNHAEEVMLLVAHLLQCTLS